MAHPAWALSTPTTALLKHHPSKTPTQTSLGVQPRSLPQDPCLESLLQPPQQRALCLGPYTSLYKGPAWSTRNTPKTLSIQSKFNNWYMYNGKKYIIIWVHTLTQGLLLDGQHLKGWTKTKILIGLAWPSLHILHHSEQLSLQWCHYRTANTVTIASLKM